MSEKQVQLNIDSIKESAWEQVVMIIDHLVGGS